MGHPGLAVLQAPALFVPRLNPWLSQILTEALEIQSDLRFKHEEIGACAKCTV
jgi:hypothetical protein